MHNPYSAYKTPPVVLLETAARLKVLRKRAKFTQASLAERAGVSLGSLKRFEQTGLIAFDSLLRLAHVLDRLADFERLFAIDPVQDAAERIFNTKMPRP